MPAVPERFLRAVLREGQPDETPWGRLGRLGRFGSLGVLLAVVAGAVQLAGTTIAGRHQSSADLRPLDAGGYLLLIAGPLLLIGCRRFPRATLLGAWVGTLVYLLLDYPRGPVFIALCLAFANAVVRGHRAVAYTLLAIGYPTFVFVVPGSSGGVPGLPVLVGIAAWLLVLLVGSELIRIKLDFLRERWRRRREAELAREEEVRRRASEERLALARELHDVMAHSISLINVQAGVALELMDRRPEQARQALTAIKAASKEALLEVQSMLTSLRQGGAAPRIGSPACPRVSALEDLVTRARLSGVRVHTRVDGEPVPLPAELDQAAARILQEALTNVARHARISAADVLVRYGDGAGGRELVVAVDNGPTARDHPAAVLDGGRADQDGGIVVVDGGPADVDGGVAADVDGGKAVVGGGPVDVGGGVAAVLEGGAPGEAGGPAAGGRGIAGMCERAAAHAGTVTAGPRPDGGFRVEARLPIPPAAAVRRPEGAGG